MEPNKNLDLRDIPNESLSLELNKKNSEISKEIDSAVMDIIKLKVGTLVKEKFSDDEKLSQEITSKFSDPEFIKSCFNRLNGIVTLSGEFIKKFENFVKENNRWDFILMIEIILQRGEIFGIEFYKKFDEKMIILGVN